MRKISLIGQRFERLTVIEEAGRTALGLVQWHCRCDCGTAVTATTNVLRMAHTRSCGCLKKEVLRNIKALNRRPIVDRLNEWSIPEPNSGCTLWIGALSTDGYGFFKYAGKMLRSHRVSYATFVGPIPDGLTLDHLCRNPSCINPQHLEPVTMRENVLRGNGPAALNARRIVCKADPPHPIDSVYVRIRGNDHRRRCSGCEQESRYRPPSTITHCPRGHEYSEENTYRPPKNPSARLCRACNRIVAARSRTQRRPL